jgi:excisionase family DNA binding protein
MEPLLTVDDLSKAWKVTPVWIYKLVREKRIPFIHVERCVRFSASEIEKWLEERRNKEWSLCLRKRGRG